MDIIKLRRFGGEGKRLNQICQTLAHAFDRAGAKPWKENTCRRLDINNNVPLEINPRIKKKAKEK